MPALRQSIPSPLNLSDSPPSSPAAPSAATSASPTAAQWLPIVYQELRRLAAAKLARENHPGTLQPTALVHEAWLKLGGSDHATWKDRRHYLGAAGEAMRHILIDRARSRQAVRHGGGLQRLELDPALAAAADTDERLIALHEALARYAQLSAEKAELVQLRYFVGLTLEEAADTLGVSVPTAKRWWQHARAWLHREISSPAAPVRPRPSSRA